MCEDEHPASGHFDTTTNIAEAVHEVGLGTAIRVIGSDVLGRTDDWATSSDWLGGKKSELDGLSVKARNAEAGLDKSRELYKANSAIAASDELWKKRQDTHNKAANGWLAATIVVALLAVAVIIVFGLNMVGIASRWQTAFPGANQTTSAIGLGIVFATSTGLIVWLVRFCSQRYASHRHLEYDAAERVVMANAYLNLMNDASKSADTHLDVILRALFRPASDGMVKDDAGPVPPSIALMHDIRNAANRE